MSPCQCQKFIPEGLHEVQHPTPLKPQHSPAKQTMPTCGAKTQHADDTYDMQPVLPENEIKHIQRAMCTTSYCASALDNTGIMALNDLAASQAPAKQSTKDALMQLLDFLSTHPNAKIRHYESPMILQMHSNASHL